MPLNKDNVTTCVRRFGRKAKGQGETSGFEQVTGARMAASNGHEVLLSWSSDAIHMYSTLDTPTEPTVSRCSSVLPSNGDTDAAATFENSASRRVVSGSALRRTVIDQVDTMMEEDIEHFMTGPIDYDDEVMSSAHPTTGDDDDVSDPNEEDITEEEEEEEEDPYPTTPVILSRRRYRGHCNVETVKDVNFLGPNDEFVVSGSDDGNWFIWETHTGRLRDILEGDGHVVNVIEGHPYLPLVAVSGIDTTVKLFGPTEGPRKFSHLQNATSITSRNAETSSQRIDLAALATYARIARLIGGVDADEEQPCTTQ